MAKIKQGYIVLVGTFLCRFVGMGLYYSGGLFLIPLSATFGIENAFAASYVSIYSSAAFLSSFLSGRLQDKLVEKGISVRPVFSLGAVLVAAGMIGASYSQSFQLVLFCAILTGTGIGFTCFSAGGVLTQWFDENRGRNLLIAMSGGGIGSFVYAQVIVAMMGAFHEGDEDCRRGVDNPSSCAEWRPTFRYLGICSSALLLLASYFMKNNAAGDEADACKDLENTTSTMSNGDLNEDSDIQDAEMTPGCRQSIERSRSTLDMVPQTKDLSDRYEQLTFRESIRTKTCVLLCLWSLSMAIVLDAYFIFAPSYAEEIGLSSAQGGAVVSIAGLALLVGNLTLGYIADLFGNIRIFQLCMTGLTIMAIAWPFCKSLGSLIVISIGVGFCTVSASLYISILTDAYGVFANDCFFSIFGLVTSLQAPSVLVGPVVIGILIDKFGYYAGAFFCAGFFAISVAIILALPSKENQLNKFRKKLNENKLAGSCANNMIVTPGINSDNDTSQHEAPIQREKRRNSSMVKQHSLSLVIQKYFVR